MNSNIGLSNQTKPVAPFKHLALGTQFCIRTKINKLLYLLVTASMASSLPGCTYFEEKPPIFLLDQSLEPQLGFLEKALLEEQTPIQFANGKSATNCKMYLQLQSKSTMVATASERVVQAQYQACAALAQLNASRALGSDILPAYDKQTQLSADLCSKLNLGNFRHSLRPRMTDKMQTAEDVLGKLPGNEGKDCAFENAEMHFELKPVVQFQDTKTSEQYLIVWLTDEILSGSYRDYQSLLVKMNSNDIWQVVDTIN